MKSHRQLLALGLALATRVLPASGPDVTVALDGSGQFTSVQEAISAAPMNTDPAAPRWVILVKPGTYHERVYVQRERGHLRIIGEDAAKTVIAYELNARLLGPDGKPIGTFRTPTVQIDGDDMIWEDLTIANTAGPGGQALALRLDGDRVVFNHCRFLGWQDTILLNRGRQYFADCHIEGHVDFIFGAATAFFDRCTIHCLLNGYITAASTPKGTAHGFVFADCKITGDEGVQTYLGRPWREFAKTVFLRTEMSAVVRPEGWDNWKKPQAEQTTFYADYASTGPGANPAARVSWAKTLTPEDVALLTPDKVLAGDDGWNPLNVPAAAGHRLHIVLVGDSTVADGGGWGRAFRSFLSPGVECTNAALNGRSSKSFRAEGHWEPALALKGDYYLIQFGHNDQPGKGPDRETDPATTYHEAMARYVDEVRAIGAEPILVTSLTRREFAKDGSGKIVSTLGPYVDAVRKVAVEKHVPLIDLYAASLVLCEQLGPEKCAALGAKKENGAVDTTHLNANGSLVFARLVVDGLRRVAPKLSPDLLAEPKASAISP
jgi:pectinesterase